MKCNSLIIIFPMLIFSCKKHDKKDDISTLSVLKIDTSRVTIFNYDNADRECKKIFLTGKKFKPGRPRSDKN